MFDDSTFPSTLPYHCHMYLPLFLNNFALFTIVSLCLHSDTPTLTLRQMVLLLNAKRYS